MAVAAPTLSKTKSKIGLRFGLTPSQLRTEDVPPLPGLSKTHASPARTLANPAHPMDLASSTSTTTSALSRMDSRSAFTYDSITYSPPTKKTDFDTISYQTLSPESVANVTERNKLDLEVAGPVEAEEEQDISDDEDVDRLYDRLARKLAEHRRAQADGDAIPYPTPITSADASYELDILADLFEPVLAADGTEAIPEDAFRLTEEQLQTRLIFKKEIGFGNWGSVWRCKRRDLKKNFYRDGLGTVQEQFEMLKIGKIAVLSSSRSGRVAVKLVHRLKDVNATCYRLRALWSEWKTVRSLRKESHPSIIQFESFVVTNKYALIVMPLLDQPISVHIPAVQAAQYFRQLASAVGYLHERGITHNDIKPANILLNHNDIPVLVDFGFAQQWDVNDRNCFLTTLVVGTPEYLDPLKARGMPHDERAADVWSLGITMFEVITGRTPFEGPEERENKDYEVYYQRAEVGHWIGQWPELPSDLEHLIRCMLYADPTHRISAVGAYHHPALQPPAPDVIITPQFVREALSFDHYGQRVTVPATLTPAKVERVMKRKVRKEAQKPLKYNTPALGESIKQHTAVSKSRLETANLVDKENRDGLEREIANSKLIIKQRQKADKVNRRNEQDITPTKTGKSAPTLRSKDHLQITNKKAVPRTSDSSPGNLARPASSTQYAGVTGDSIPAANVLSHSVSTSTLRHRRGDVSGASKTDKKKEEVLLKTMKSLEGKRKVIHQSSADRKAVEALAAVRRAAPEPPRAVSADLVTLSQGVRDPIDARRSLALERTLRSHTYVNEEDVPSYDHKAHAAVHFEQNSPRPHDTTDQLDSPSRAGRSSTLRLPTPSPQKVRRGREPGEEIDRLRNKIFPPTDDESPFSELRSRTVHDDAAQAVKYRQSFGDMETLMSTARDAPPTLTLDEAHTATVPDSEPSPAFSYESARPTSSLLPVNRSVEALAMDDKLLKMSTWMKSVEHIIEDARKAIAEGRDIPLPVLTYPSEAATESQKQEHTSGSEAENDKVAQAPVPASSVQVRPLSTTIRVHDPEHPESESAEEFVAESRKAKKDRPTVSHVLKLFGGEKQRPASESRAKTPDIAQLVPLKPPAQTLRGAPSTPALRQSTHRGLAQMPQRKSESNLRNFNTLPVIPSSSFVAGPEYDPAAEQLEDENDAEVMEDLPLGVGSPRRMRYETILSSEAGVVRQGEGWGSLSRAKGSAFTTNNTMKPSSSMASLRDRARAILEGPKHDSKRDSTTHRIEKRSSRLTLNEAFSFGGHGHGQSTAGRPSTPGAQSMLALKTEHHATAQTGTTKKGWLKSLKGAMGKRHGVKKEMERVDAV
ncbi:hypothetical protein IAU60_003666 [Kwoniella sp. DSM 27419]